MENSAQSARLPHLHESELFHAIKNPAFRRIGLMGRAGKRSVIESLIQVASTVNEMNLTLIMDVQTANLPTLNLVDIEKVKIVKRSLIGEICDLVIVVGGDGSEEGFTRPGRLAHDARPAVRRLQKVHDADSAVASTRA